jgi:hypothetical protein
VEVPSVPSQPSRELLPFVMIDPIEYEEVNKIEEVKEPNDYKEAIKSEE